MENQSNLMPTSANEWIDYLVKKYGNHFMIAYLKENPNFYNLTKAPAKGFSPRKVESAIQTLSSLGEITKENKKIVKTILRSFFTEEDANNILSFVDKQKK